GGIATKASEVINFIQAGFIPYSEDEDAGRKKVKSLTETFGFTFDKVDGLPQLAKPCMLGKFITEKQITPEKYKAFLKHVKKFDIPQLTYYCQPLGDLDVKIPYYLNTNFWLKMYSLETPFYGNTNKDLTNLGIGDIDLSVYDPFIFSMYMGLKEGYLESYRGKLYRGSLLSKDEIKSLQDKFDKVKEARADSDDSLTLCTTKCFLSFSTIEKVAVDFVNESMKKNKNDNLKPAFFEIKAIPEDKGEDYFVSNVVIGNLGQEDESEVLILPFSCFEVSDISEEDGVTIITMKHLYKKEQEIKDYIKWEGKENVAKFLNAGNEKSAIDSRAVDDCSSADFFNKKMIVWIDQFAKCEKYQKEIDNHKDDLEDYQVYRVNSVDKGFDILKMHENKLSYVILSQYLAKEFYERYEKEALDNRLITANIILCENNYKELKNEYIKTFKEVGFLDDPYKNPGGFVETFDDALAYIKKDERGLKKPEKTKDDCEIADSYESTFIIEEGDIRDGYFGRYKNKKGEEDTEAIQKDLKRFRYFIEKAYGKSKKPEVKEYLILADPTEEKNIPLPAELYATNFMKMYVSNGLDVNDPENFFTNMNMDLTQDDDTKISRYLPYIYTIYLGVKAKMVKNYKKALYRAGCLTDKEIDKLQKKLQKKNPLLVWPKPFLSFFKSNDAADAFLKEYDLGARGADCSKVKFILEKPKEDIFINNMDTGKFARFKKDQEVVTLPFTPFLIKDIKEETGKGKGNDYYVITMEYADINRPTFYKEDDLDDDDDERNKDSDDEVDAPRSFK
ncbi:MAG: hypothetical protein MJ252_22710, partial [archaeon]|nr:hypothetical protein [archaeon]